MAEPPVEPVRLATWNLNSVRARLPLVERFLDDTRPDIVCFQETKVEDARFPLSVFTERGYSHRVIRGEPGYNGVAIFSRLPLGDSEVLNWCGQDDTRHIATRLPGGLPLHNFYVPAGGDVPDAEANPRYAHKLDFLDEMIDWSGALGEPAILVGDLNVAPLETDVWSHKQLLNVISHTPPETERLTALQDAHGWVDAMRRFVPPEEKLFSWWSYRARDWRASNRGRRLDHIWVSPQLAPFLRTMRVLVEARGWPRPSDHAPVLVDLDLPLDRGALEG